jgi:putative endonuclease
MDNKRILGISGEELTAREIQKAGLSIIARNYRCPKGEMDIIARDHDTLVFIEVRTRQSSFRGWGEESITQKKARRLRAIASFYIVQEGYKTWPSLRFDVVAIRWLRGNSEIKWFKAAL